MSYLNRHTDPGMKTQKERLNDRQAKNNISGYSYVLDKFSQLRRFLILGSESGSYYANEQKHTEKNLTVLDICLKADGLQVIREIVAISDGGRAPKNDQTILALAKATVHEDLNVRKAAWDALPKVCRIGTHLYMFNEFRKHFGGGWGRSAKKAVSNWYLDRSPMSLAVQVAKYKQRDGWSARDLLRLSHPKTDNAQKNDIMQWVVSNGEYNGEELIPFLRACNEIKNASESEAVMLIRKQQLPREVVPTQMLKSKAVWEAMLPHMKAGAMIRNLGKMTSIGLLSPNSEALRHVCNELDKEEFIKSARMHPVNILTALLTYNNGKGTRGSLTWNVVPAIKDALEEGFYHSFKTVEPTGQRTMMAYDVSGSMYGNRYNPWVNGVQGLDSAVISATMGMVTMRTEKHNCHPVAFSHEMVDLPITRTDSLIDVLNKMRRVRMGRTDCSLPMIHAAQKRIPVDTFIIYTDNETWAGTKHPSVALQEYRKKMGIPAKLVVCGVTATRFTIADPKDAGMIDVVGFDSAAPQIISEFARGNI